MKRQKVKMIKERGNWEEGRKGKEITGKKGGSKEGNKRKGKEIKVKVAHIYDLHGKENKRKAEEENIMCHRKMKTEVPQKRRK